MRGQLQLRFLLTGQTAVVDQGLIAGRSRTKSGLVLVDYFQGETTTISGRHFKLSQWENGQFVIHDLGSSNGTYLNGEKLFPNLERILEDGDVIQVGKSKDFRIRVDIESDEHSEYELSVQTILERKTEMGAVGIFVKKDSKQFILDGHEIPENYLSDQEFDLLHLFYKNIDMVCQFSDIEATVWGIPVDKDTIRQKVSSLRKKLDAISSKAGKRYIHNIRGYGYRLTNKKNIFE